MCVRARPPGTPAAASSHRCAAVAPSYSARGRARSCGFVGGQRSVVVLRFWVQDCERSAQPVAEVAVVRGARSGSDRLRRWTRCQGRCPPAECGGPVWRLPGPHTGGMWTDPARAGAAPAGYWARALGPRMDRYGGCSSSLHVNVCRLGGSCRLGIEAVRTAAAYRQILRRSSTVHVRTTVRSKNDCRLLAGTGDCPVRVEFMRLLQP
jgi:hypothetical protein